MSTTRRVLLGILAIWPVLYFFLFLAFFLVTFFTMSLGDPSSDGFGAVFFMIFPLHVLTMLVIMAEIAIYLVLVVKNKDLDESMRIVWVIVIAMFAIFAAPAYWWLYVRTARPAPTEP